MQSFHRTNGDDEVQGELDGNLMVSPSSERGAMPIRRTAAKVGRNDSCHCGSGKKFEKCCESHWQPRESIN